MHIVRFYFVRGDGRAVAYNLTQNVPTSSSTLVAGSFPEGYDALSRPAGLSPESRSVPKPSTTRWVCCAPRPTTAGTNRRAGCCPSSIVPVSEGTRSGPISTNTYRTTRNFQQYARTDHNVTRMRSWFRVSGIYRNNGGASVTLYGQVINSARAAASLLLTALGGQGGVPNDEL
ncbi:hypothetical protein [Streptomyces sp. NPDC058086]|uniref:hypothetical protein n=1 Tax=Streptomyces sp. NPDC058086 TaxID=3346334 RepID=UPI0036F086E9